MVKFTHKLQMIIYDYIALSHRKNIYILFKIRAKIKPNYYFINKST